MTQNWNFKTTNALRVDSPGVCTSSKSLYSSTIKEIHLVSEVIDGFIVGGIRNPLLYYFVVSKPAGYKVFCEPETIHYKKVEKSVLKSITFPLEDDYHMEVNFNRETSTFNLQMVKFSIHK